MYAVSFLFLPIASDIFMNLTNINWITSLYLINFLFVRHTDYTNRNRYLNLFAIAIISLSGPFSTLLIPLVLAVIVLERKELSFRKMAPLLLILVGGIVQFACIKYIDPGFYRGVKETPEPYHLLKLLTNNVNEYLFLNRLDKWLSPVWINLISFSIFLALLYLFIIAYIKIKNKRRYLILWYAVIVFISFIKVYWPNESRLLATCNARYYFIPFTCVCWLVILSFDEKIKPVYVMTYLVIFCISSRHIRMNLPDKQWKKEITEYYDGKRQQIDISPDGWQFTFPKENKNQAK